MTEELNAKVVGKQEFAPGNFVLRVAPVGWELPEFKPGQYTVLGLPGSAPRAPFSDAEDPVPDPDKLIRRAYSVASPSPTREYAEFYVAMVRSGALTPRLYALNIGDKVWLGKKFTGLMTLEEVPADANVVLIATGTGLAPYMSMIRTLVLTKGFDRHYAVIHGAKHSWDLGYRSELETMERMTHKLAYLPVISQPSEEHMSWSGATGFVEDAWKSGALEKAWKQRPAPGNTHVFLCGNPMMIQSAFSFLGAEGFKEHSRREAGQIHVEKYW
ncbi:MAG: ferredoxin--NADP reductase [Elusimicrobiota bacterium]|jgi:ferredoxin--NADP+ reductase